MNGTLVDKLGGTLVSNFGKTSQSKKSMMTSARRKQKKNKHKLPLTNTLDLVNINKDSARDMTHAPYDYGAESKSRKLLQMQYQPEILTLQAYNQSHQTLNQSDIAAKARKRLIEKSLKDVRQMQTINVGSRSGKGFRPTTAKVKTEGGIISQNLSQISVSNLVTQRDNKKSDTKFKGNNYSQKSLNIGSSQSNQSFASLTTKNNFAKGYYETRGKSMVDSLRQNTQSQSKGKS